MEVQAEQTTTSESTATPTASTEAASASGTQSTSTAAETAPASSQAATSGENTAAAPVYTPNYKYKVMDKELEVPEMFKGLVKDAATEKQIKEILEKAEGLPEVKKSRDSVREELKSYKSQVEPTVATVTQASQLYQQGVRSMQEGNARAGVFKLEESFKLMGIPDKVLQQYVYQKLQLDELPPEQKASYNRERELERQNAQYQEQLTQVQTQYQQTAISQRQQELNQVFSKPEIQSIVQSFDQRNGPGSFHNEVVLRGRMYATTYNQDISAEQAVSEIIQKYGLQAPAAVAPQQQVAAQGAVPVIPAVKGGTASPAGRSFKSTEDLVRYRNEKFGY